MKNYKSIGNRLVALLLCAVMILGMLPMQIIAVGETRTGPVAKIGGMTYDTLEEAVDAVGVKNVTTITLLHDTTDSFDVGSSNGKELKNIVLDLNGKTLTLAPGIGSTGTETNGIRVLANSKLTIKNGTVECSSGNRIKVGIANYSELTLEDVNVVSGDQTIYTINNRGKLILSGTTKVANGNVKVKVEKGTENERDVNVAITNDPYNYVYTEKKNASIHCASGVTVGNILVERYERTSQNQGNIELDISAGTFGDIVEDGAKNISVTGNITGGTFVVSDGTALKQVLSMVKAGENSKCPESAVTIKLSGDMSTSFDVGSSNGKEPKNIVLDLNGKKLTLAPGIGSTGTQTNGIRVLANSKLTIKNGTVECSSGNRIKVGIANYSELTLEDVNVVSGDQTIYTINNRGSLTLSGETKVENGEVPVTLGKGTEKVNVAITNDPYDLVYTENVNATLVCKSENGSNVNVGNILVERYGRDSKNQGDIVLDISAGTFGDIVEDGAEGIGVTGNITGGTFGSNVTVYISNKDYNCVKIGENEWVVKKDQNKPEPPVSFEKDDKVEITFGENEFQNELKNYKVATGNVTYEIISQKDVNGKDVSGANDKPVAKIDKYNGTLTIFKAGTVEVQATAAGNEEYNPVTKKYTLTIKRGERGLKFENGNEPTGTYGITQYENGLKGTSSDDKVTYQFVGENTIGAVLDNDGILKFGDSADKVGTVTVKATIAANDCYVEQEISYTLELDYLSSNGLNCTLTGNHENDEWFTGDVTINPPDGYLISYSNEIFSNWSESLTCSEEGVHENVEVYLKQKGKGYITGAIELGTIRLDKSDPTDLSIECFDNAGNKITDSWYATNGTIKLVFSAVDKESGIEKIEYSVDSGENWIDADFSNDVYSATLSGEIKITEIQVRAANHAGVTSEAYTETKTLIIDKTDPEITIYYYPVSFAALQASAEEDDAPTWGKVRTEIGDKEYLFAKDVVCIDIILKDDSSGIAGGSYTLGNGDPVKIEGVEASISIPAQFRNTLSVTATDNAGNTAEANSKGDIIVDNVAPEVEITFAGVGDNVSLKNKVDKDNKIVDTIAEDTRFIYNGEVQVTLTVTEANFFAEFVKIEVTKGGNPISYVSSDWTPAENAENQWCKTLTFSEDGDYDITVKYFDGSGNGMKWMSNEGGTTATGTDNYQSHIFVIDKTAPVVEITYDNVGKFDYRTATITIKDPNFNPNNGGSVDFKVVAENVNGTYTPKELKWTKEDTTWTKEDTTWTAEVPFGVDGIYTLELSCKDLAGYSAPKKEQTFTIDHEAPKNLKIEYSTSVLDKVLEKITFGYYKANCEVKLTAEDVTSGIDFFMITANAEGPTSATNLKLPENMVVDMKGIISGTKGFVNKVKIEKDGNQVSVRFKVPAQFRGTFEFSATDKAGLNSKTAKSKTLVVDNISPKCTVTYEPSAIVDRSTLKNVASMTAKDNVILYYNKNAVATLKIVEANFYADDVVVKVNGKDARLDGAWVSPDGQGDNVWTNTLTLKKEGDYVITIEYKDRSSNEMATYTSQTIVIDKTAPVIDVRYSNTDVKNTIDGRSYFSAAQSATITIKEHNFRADDVVIRVTAKDVLGNDVLKLNADGTVVKAYADQGTNRKSWSSYEAGTWRRSDDTYVITLNYSQDANYTFDIAYQDLAGNKAANYAQDKFTVDTTAPKNLTVKYSTSVLEQIKESVTFGYYNARMTVTITAEDDTSGIYHFAYSYMNSEGVSSVNQQLLDQAIREAEITYDGKKATAVFTVPKMVLGSDNQFNGTVRFTAYDRGESNTELRDSTRIVVDNISPTATITYNDPVQNYNGTSYYNGNINASIVITEANFDSADVVVTVTRGGVAYPVTVAWHDDSVDRHTGSFTLSEDGDYVVSVGYRDKSGNKMADYTSNQLTLDAVLPTVQVSNIKANSANKDDQYGFALEIHDINLDVSSMKPVLRAVVKNSEGVYETVEIELGEPEKIANGQTYRYVVENLPEDALYTLNCEVKDLSGNVMSQVVLDDGNAYEQVSFSVNRNGSVFGYGNTFTEELVDRYYVYNVKEDVVIVEVNVDPVEEYKLTLNGTELVEGSDYTTEQTSKEGEWSKRTYTIKKEVFENEGEYSVVVSSTDKTGTTAFSDVKSLTLAFVVDRTKPVLTITGLESGGRYQTDVQTVTLIPTDEGGRLNDLSVVVLDADGEPLKDSNGNDISVRFSMSGDELLKYLEANDGKVTLTIPEGLNNQIQILCNDCAVDGDGSANVYSETFTKVTVSPSALIIFFANKPLFYGTIGGGVAVIVLPVLILVRSRSKKKEKKDPKSKA